jgi:chromosome segregation ATPase
MLTAAEIHLGQLGWQQVDFPPEVERQIHAINAVELKQAQISNQSADIQSNIDDLQRRREVNKKLLDGMISGIEADKAPLLQAREVARQPLAVKQEGIRRFEQAMAGVMKNHAALALEIQQLNSISQPDLDVQQELVQLKDRLIECDFEREDMQRAVMRLENEIKAQMQQVAVLDLKIQDHDIKISDARDTFNAGDKELVAEINSLQRGKRETTKMVDRLDKRKSDAYLQVGRCLADFNIAPRNQPESLQHVLTHRDIVRSYEQSMTESLEASSQISPGTMRKFYIFIIIFFGAIALAAAFLLKSPGHVASGIKSANVHRESLYPGSRFTHSSMMAMCAETRWSSANSDGVSMVKVRLE